MNSEKLSPQFLGLTIERDVVEQARRLGLCDGNNRVVRHKIQNMIRYSANITHPNGNKRFDDWLFQVTAIRVTNVYLITCSMCDGRRRTIVYNECAKCEGLGCKHCKKGLTKGDIPCNNCN